MKLLIHIGTQKTATTSIQRFCVLNREFLLSRGYLYPQNNQHAFLFNFLADQLAEGKQDSVARYLQEICVQGKREKCHTVIVSAESFYAMSMYFLYPRESSRADEYWQIEARLIAALHQCCSGFDDIKVACYLRPQDDFAASFYNQLVKNSFYFSDTYEAFIKTVRPIFDYERHIRLWENTFGENSVLIRNFLTCKGDVVEDFFEHCLEPKLFCETTKMEYRSNLRLSRDVMECKRIFNQTRPNLPLAQIGLRFYNDISPEFVDISGYQVFATPDYRKEFFGRYSAGNDSLAERYDLGDLPVISTQQDPTYPGLSKETALDIDRRWQRLLANPGVRIELALRRLASTIRDRVPGGKWLWSPVRIIKIRMRSRFSRR